MTITKLPRKSLKDNSVVTDNFSCSAVSACKVGPDAVTSAKIKNTEITGDDFASSIDLSSKTVTLPNNIVSGSNFVSTVDMSSKTVTVPDSAYTKQFNQISLLGFKMAVNENLTVFNLIDGVVDEFHDESGTDESEGSNDNYCATCDFYCNATPGSAGFTSTLKTVTEPTTSTAMSGDYCSAAAGTFTVPCGVETLTASLWGAGGSGQDRCCASIGGGGGGFTKGCLAVTGGQVIQVIVGEGGMQPHGPGFHDRCGAFFGGGGGEGMDAGSGYGGGLTALVSQMTGFTHEEAVGAPDGIPAPGQSPYVYMVAGAGGGGGGHIPGNPGHFSNPSPTGDGSRFGGAGGGLIGFTGGNIAQQTTAIDNDDGPTYSPLPITGGWPSCRGHYMGGGGSQTTGGQSGGGEPAPQYGGGFSGAFFEGGGAHGHNQPNKCNPLSSGPGDHNMGTGGAGYFGGGGGGYSPQPQSGNRSGGGGSSYYGHPQVTNGTTTAGSHGEGGGVSDPNYVTCTNDGLDATPVPQGTAKTPIGDDGYVLLTYTTAVSSTIISTSFTANSVPTTSRIVVFEENIGTPTLNTDIIASISRDGGSNYTNATLADSGYVTGNSGQRILTGQATISGQPSGQSMRWKLQLANAAVKIHGVSLSWS